MIEMWHLWLVAIVAATLSYVLGAWMGTGKEPVKQESTLQEATPQEDTPEQYDTDYCAVCPFNPHEGDDENG